MSSSIRRRLEALAPTTGTGPVGFSHVFLVPLRGKHDTSPPSDPRYACMVPGRLSGAIGSDPGESYEDFQARMQQEYPSNATQ